MARTYEETHPWINFLLDMRLFDPHLWMALGESASKCQHIAGVPLAPAIAQQMHRLYLIKGAVATTAIEGNTLSEEEAEKIVEGTLRLPPSQKYLADELTNIIDAVNSLIEDLGDQKSHEDYAISVDLLKRMNKMVLKDLELDDDIKPGEIREHKVVVGRYRCAPVEDCEYLLEKFCDEINKFPCSGPERRQYCIIKAIFAHLYFVWIHPFGDGNGRTARLLELYILMAAGFPQPTGHLLSNHYNRTRSKYYEKLEGAVHGQDGVISFIKYSVQGFVDGLREQIDFIREQQWNVAWVNYVHDRFHDKNSTTDVRRRHLVIALTGMKNGITTANISNSTPQMAKEYFGKTPKTVTRDVNWLIEQELVTRDRKGIVRANREKILAFLPWRTPSDDGIPAWEP